jgi:hypothetical protein
VAQIEKGCGNFWSRRATIGGPFMDARLDDVRELDGRVVLVRSARDTHNPPTALRGNIAVKEHIQEGTATVCVVLNLPDMFTSPAHSRVIPLDEQQLQQLLASERNGTYELVIQDALD